MTWYHAVFAAIWMMKPIETMRDQKEIDGFRPNLSATGAATRAPIRVPIERRGQ